MPATPPTRSASSAPSPLLWPVRAIRRRLSMESTRESLKTLVWVAPLTVLIWFYAERKAATAPVKVQFSVEVTSPVPGQIVKTDAKVAGSFSAKLNGPLGSVTDAQRELLKRPLRIQLKADEPLNVERTLVADVIERSEFFNAYAGVTVSDVTPAELVYRIDRISERQVPIRIRDELQAQLSDVPAFDPPTVKVIGPEETLKQADAANELVAYADFAGRTELRTPGAHDLFNVPLRLASTRSDLSLATTYTLAKVQVKQPDQTRVIGSVPIWIAASPPVLDRFTIELKEATIDRVTCIGPDDAIASLDKRVLTARLTVTIDKSRSTEWQTGEVTYDLPARVTVDPASARRTVQFKVKPREGSTP